MRCVEICHAVGASVAQECAPPYCHFWGLYALGLRFLAVTPQYLPPTIFISVPGWRCLRMLIGMHAI